MTSEALFLQAAQKIGIEGVSPTHVLNILRYKVAANTDNILDPHELGDLYGISDFRIENIEVGNMDQCIEILKTMKHMISKEIFWNQFWKLPGIYNEKLDMLIEHGIVQSREDYERYYKVFSNISIEVLQLLLPLTSNELAFVEENIFSFISLEYNSGFDQCNRANRFNFLIFHFMGNDVGKLDTSVIEKISMIDIPYEAYGLNIFRLIAQRIIRNGFNSDVMNFDDFMYVDDDINIGDAIADNCENTDLGNMVVMKEKIQDAYIFLLNNKIIGHVKTHGVKSFLSHRNIVDNSGKLVLLKGGLYSLGDNYGGNLREQREGFIKGSLNTVDASTFQYSFLRYISLDEGPNDNIIGDYSKKLEALIT